MGRKPRERDKNTEQERQIDQNEEELKRMQEEYQEMMRELMKETIEESMEDALELDELGEELMGTIHVDMDPEDLERLKKSTEQMSFGKLWKRI